MKKLYKIRKSNIDNKDVFYIALERALLNFFKLKFSIESSDLSKQRIKKIFEDQNTDPSIIDLFLKLIENCEYARYTPSSDSAILKDYDSSVQLISDIDKQIK